MSPRRRTNGSLAQSIVWDPRVFPGVASIGQILFRSNPVLRILAPTHTGMNTRISLSTLSLAGTLAATCLLLAFAFFQDMEVGARAPSDVPRHPAERAEMRRTTLALPEDWPPKGTAPAPAPAPAKGNDRGTATRRPPHLQSKSDHIHLQGTCARARGRGRGRGR
ncbi:hypothetical protein B0H14DRAFT_3852915, partial [Mycena olivaceomarginata]